MQGSTKVVTNYKSMVWTNSLTSYNDDKKSRRIKTSLYLVNPPLRHLWLFVSVDTFGAKHRRRPAILNASQQ